MLGTARPTKGRLSGLSGLTGNCHGPFLGGWGAAMPPGYPTVPRTSAGLGGGSRLDLTRTASNFGLSSWRVLYPSRTT